MNDMVNENEVISALADGQLRGDEFTRAVESVIANAQSRATWHAYHVVGDVLRSGELAACRQDGAFIARLNTRLQQEQIQVPSRSAMSPVATNAYSAKAGGKNDARKFAANESSFRWKLIAGFASLAAVAAISWNGLAGWGLAASQPQLAQAVMPVQPQAVQPAVAVADSDSPVMIRDPRLDAFLAAHEQFGGTSALQMPSGFLRNATFEGQAR